MTRLLRPVGLVVLGAVAALGIQRLVAGPGVDRSAVLERLAARQDERLSDVATRLREGAAAAREAEVSQLYRLNEFRLFANDGLALVWIVPADAEATGDPLERAAAGPATRLPRLAIDAAAREAWGRAAARLDGYASGVDERVFAAFEQVRAFAAEHPWPAGTGPAAVAASSWASPEVVEAWLSLNRALVTRVDGALAGF